jgi:glycosidase
LTKNRIISFCLLFIFITAQIVSAQVKSVNHTSWSRNQTIYEVNVRQYSKEGTFKAVEKDLERLKQLGVGIVWLMPINPIGEVNRKGTLGSYYSVKDYLDVNPEFGTKEDFRSLVKKVHNYDMKIIIDWVANHTSWDNALTKTHPDFYMKDSLGNFMPPVRDWSDVIDLNYDNKDLWKYMSDALAYWIKEFDIDGYRCDVAGMLPIEFWNYAYNEISKIKPIFMLAEEEKPEMHSAFDMTYGWNLYHLLNEIARGKKNANDLGAYFIKDETDYPEDAYRMYFITNHDENSWNGTEFERLGPAVEACAVLTATAKGMPLMYNGQEIGLNKRLNFFEKDPIEWIDSKYEEFYSALFNLKLKNKVLLNGNEGGEAIRIPSTNDKAVYAFVREKEEDKVLVIINLSDKSQDVTLSGEEMKGKYKDLFTKEKITVKSKHDFSLEPWDYMVYVK